MKQKQELSESQISEIIQMALSDHVAFSDIEHQYGLKEREVVTLMRKSLRKGSYRSWRKRVATFGSRREHYK
ncbi:MAG: TIGR03643 family protein [Alphaproteobacteria bacterium]